MADKIDFAERFMFLEAVMYMDRSGDLLLLENMAIPEELRNIHWDRTLRSGNEMYSRISAAMRLKDHASRATQLQEIEADYHARREKSRDVREQIKRILAAKDPADVLGKAVGDTLIWLMFPAAVRMQNIHDRAEQNEQNVHVAFALAAYKSDNGKYPKSLDPLAPSIWQPSRTISSAARR